MPVSIDITSFLVVASVAAGALVALRLSIAVHRRRSAERTRGILKTAGAQQSR